MAGYPVQEFDTFQQLLTYINTQWITNGNGDITGIVGNNVVNGLLKFIIQSPLNYAKADIVSTSSTYTAVHGCTVFMTSAPSSFSWGDNINNEWLFINTTSTSIPLISGLVWYDIDLNPNSFVPSKERLHIIKAANGMWIQASDFSSSITPPPVVTGPSSQAVNVGDDATFTITVSSPISYTIQWYVNGSPISGATLASYVKTNCQLSDSGEVYYAIASSSSGDTQSQNATLTVEQIITGYLYYSPNDPGPTLQGQTDPFTYQFNYPITHDADIPIMLPSASSPFQYNVFKIPSTESAKTYFTNDQNNFGAIPGFVFADPITFGGFTYYYTTNLASFNTSVVFTLKNNQ